MQNSTNEAIDTAEWLLEGTINSDAVVDWQPFPDSPQERAFHSEADIIGYGGAAGGGKTDLLLGKAFRKFKNARIFRREYADLADIIDRGNNILAGVASFVSGEKRRWSLPGDRKVRLSAVQHEKDLAGFRGRPADFLGFDEATEFPEKFIRFLAGWLRTDDPTIKPQILLTFNPPQSAEGEWVVEFFKPWVDVKHPNPAKDGELRWYITVKDKDVEVDGPDSVTIDDKTYTPKSRTFFKALVEHNPVYMASGYDKQLESLQEPLRSQLRNGDFSIRLTDDTYQVIPTLWVLLANQRWEQGKRPDVKPRAIAADVARGGKDETTIATVRKNWIDVFGVPGVDTPTGDSVADLIEPDYHPDVSVTIDVIGIGASAYDASVKRFNRVYGFVAGESSNRLDRSGMYGFINLRAEAWWGLREALNPETGDDLALPPLPKLRSDLTAPRYMVQKGNYKVESKEDIEKRIHRSTDYGDAVVMAWWLCSRPNPANYLAFVELE